MTADVTKVDAPGFADGPAPRLLPLTPSDDAMPGWWRAVEALLDEEPFYEFGEVKS